MAPGSDRGRRRASTSRSLEDCCCPVCLEIYMEPVTLPCTHTFCKACFLESVDKAALCCPLCRRRVSTWARLNSRTNTLVDQQLWTHIQTRFPLQCQRRLNGQDAIAEDDPGVSVCVPRLCQPGELKQEYEDQVTRLTEERRALDEEERRASEELIQKLLQEEQLLLQEETRRRQEDERLARRLSTQLNSSSQDEVTPAKKKKVNVGQMERFLSPLRPLPPLSSFTVDQVEAPPPELDYYGAQTNGSDRLHLGGPSSAKRRRSEEETTTEEEEEEQLLRRRQEEEEQLLRRRQQEEEEEEQLLRRRQQEEELLRRRQQEEEDRRLAQLLQKELDQEEKRRATDRCKGSSDAYPLRQNPRKSSSSSSSSGKTTNSSSSSSSSGKTTNSSSSSSSGKTKNSSSSSGKTTNSSSSSGKPPHSRGGRQATLTEMFSSVSS